jgi:hypothetical protein
MLGMRHPCAIVQFLRRGVGELSGVEEAAHAAAISRLVAGKRACHAATLFRL